jgi:type VI secretion system secreted protein Hcp
MAVDMFMQITKVTGESTDKQFAGAIEVVSWNWGLTQSGSAHSGTGSGAGKVHVNDLSFVKFVDTASPVLTMACCNGQAFPKATLSLRKAGASALVYLVVTLQNVMVSSVALATSGGDDRQTEVVSLNFSQFTYQYTPQKSDGTGGAAITVTWNIPGNTPTLA